MPPKLEDLIQSPVFKMYNDGAEGYMYNDVFNSRLFKTMLEMYSDAIWKKEDILDDSNEPVIDEVEQKPMPKLRIVESVTLHFKKGSSDKIYEIYLKESEDGDEWICTASYGRRGSVLRPAPKYRGYSEEKARQIYNSILDKQLKEGYKDITNGVTATGTTKVKPSLPEVKPERDIIIGDL